MEKKQWEKRKDELKKKVPTFVNPQNLIQNYAGKKCISGVVSLIQ